MNRSLLKIAVALLLFANPSTLQAKFATLVIGGNVLTNEVTIGANEVAEVKSSFDASAFAGGPGSAYLLVKKGIQSARLTGESFRPTYGLFRGPVIIAGPSTISLRTLNEEQLSGEFQTAFVTLEITPESFPPDKTVIVPAGTGANIMLESSTNLIDWMPAPPGAYTNRTVNLFFRIRAERVP